MCWVARKIEGDIYSTVKIGDQILSSENLKTTTFRDGTRIQVASGESVWASVPLPAFVGIKTIIIIKMFMVHYIIGIPSTLV